ncbi:MAG: ABC transporter ATP-binding protein [Thiomonas sp.]
MSAIDIDHVDKRYGAQPVLQALSLRIAAGEFVTLLGASGSGKTTLLRILAGLERADAGRVVIGDAVAQDGKRFLPPQARGLGMVFQNYALWPHLDVAGNLALALREQGLARSEIAQRIDEALQMVELVGLQRRAIHQLSGGQQQRVALARALVARPRVLLMDEPLSNLDAALREELREQIRALQQRLGITTVFVTHDQTEALAISDRIALLHQGRLVALGAPDVLYREPPDDYTARFLGKVNVLRGVAEGAGVRVGSALLCTLASDALPGQAVRLLIRPQALRWADGMGGMAARIVSVQLLGALREYRLHLAALDAELVLAELSDAPARCGEQSVELPAAALRVLRDCGDQAAG